MYLCWFQIGLIQLFGASNDRHDVVDQVVDLEIANADIELASDFIHHNYM